MFLPHLYHPAEVIDRREAALVTTVAGGGNQETGMKRIWRITPHDQSRVESLIATAGVTPVVAQLLVARGVYTAPAAATFLDSKLVRLRDPLELPGVPEAVAIITDAIDAEHPITIYGDYDCDGMTGTAILYNGLKLLGGNVSYHVPNRLEDGYGLNETAIRRLAERGKKLIITVDCGITSVGHAALCRELGIRLIITDHHTIGGDLPAADAIVHPRLPDSDYPFGELCGAGVAFKLAWALCQKVAGGKKVTQPMRHYLMQSLALAAIGTIADVVPLVDENRILVEHGLRTLRADPLPGLDELMTVIKIDRSEAFDTEKVSFALAPRLNASGRLGQAQLGVELMTLPAGERCASLAAYINELNGSRDSLQRSVMKEANKQAKEQFDVEGDAALVLAGVGWHQGVIGVVAGRLAEKFVKPVIVLSLDSSGRGQAVGSGRVGGTGINLYDALAACDHHLVKFGGHAAAAGVTIEERSLEAFRGDFCEAVATQWDEKDIVPEIRIDAETPIGQLDLNLLKQIDTLGPFGAGNPRPVLCCGGVTLAGKASTMGAGDRHLTVQLTQGGKRIRAVAFGGGSWCDELNELDGPIEIVYRPVINSFNGFRKVEIHLIDWRMSETLAPVA